LQGIGDPVTWLGPWHFEKNTKPNTKEQYPELDESEEAGRTFNLAKQDV